MHQKFHLLVAAGLACSTDPVPPPWPGPAMPPLHTVAWQQAPSIQGQEGRRYWRVALDSLAIGHVPHTHVAVRGRVTGKHWEPDGDLHLRLSSAAGRFIVAECVPTGCGNCKTLDAAGMFPFGKRVTLLGISRYDPEHKWWEVHPVESIVEVEP